MKKLRELKELESKFNFKSYLEDLSSVKTSVKNKIIKLHNNAVEEEYYGEGLLQILMSLQTTGEIQEQDVEQLYILSLEWPHDIHIQMLDDDK